MQELTISWRMIVRILLKALVLFVAFNLLFALLNPMQTLGHLTLYNGVLQGRERLPYGDNPPADFAVTTENLPALIGSHVINRTKADDEYRVIVLGDSGTWGWFLQHDDTLSAQLSGRLLPDGRTIYAYNLAYPQTSVFKDLLLLSQLTDYDADLILFPVTLQSFAPSQQTSPPLVTQNADLAQRLVDDYALNINTDTLNANDDLLSAILSRTIIAQRDELWKLIRLQTYGVSWSATGIDQQIPDDIERVSNDLDADVSWFDFDTETTLTADDLAFDVIDASIALSGNVPVLVVNEPIFIADGENSDLRYNSFYPQWAYDQYRDLFNASDWWTLDVWDAIAPENFTDTPLHLTPNGMAQYADIVYDEIVENVR